MKTSFAAIISLVAAVSALPTADLVKRDHALVRLCTGENIMGECTLMSIEYNKCIPLIAPYLKNTGTFLVEPGSFCRITYTADTCTTHGDAFINPTPGAPFLHHFEDAQGNIVDAGSSITSFLCQECTSCT